MNRPKYLPPSDPFLAEWFAELDDDAMEFFQERAGIREFDGRLTRAKAEAAAFDDTCIYLQQRKARQ